ncbi:hypothetical protein JCM8208_004147 [Rhodotorula glutinis]
MGLFSRKKQREPPPPSTSPPPSHPHPPPGPRPSTSAPATTTLATSSHLSSSHASSYGRASTSYDDRPSTDAYSPELASSSNSRVFRGHAARAASSSTLSLPSFGNGRDPGAPRQRQASATATVMSSVDEHDPPTTAGAGSVGAQGGSKWASKWKFGRGSKGRQGSSSSATGGDGPGLGIVDGDGDSGFVVRSFRTVSRVQEDRAPSSSAVQPAPPPPVPPVSYHPKPVAVVESRPPHDLALEPQESLRTSIDFNNPSNHSRPPSSFHYPRRPSLATLGGGAQPSSSSSAWERAPSPTMTAEAFRFRSRSTLSLASVTDLALAPGLGLESSSDPNAPRERPRFEPQQRPSSASRRGSTYSELGASTGSAAGSILAPPRPSFVGMHSNSSNSSVGSRASSSASLGRQGRDGLPSPSGGGGAAASAPSSPGGQGSSAGGQVDEARRPSMGYERPTMSTSTSLFSMASYSTAQQQPVAQSQSRSGTSTPVRPSTRHASPATSPTTSTAPTPLTHEHERRPAPPQRMSTDDSELRLIAAYGDMLNSSPPVASPVELAPSPEPGRLLSYATPRKVSDGPRSDTAPAVAVQPPTPQSVPGFASSSTSPPTGTRRASTLVPRPQRSSSLFNESAQAALAAMGVGAAPAPAATRAPAGAAASSARAQRAKGTNAVYPSRGGAGGWASDSSEGDEERLSSSSDEEDEGEGGGSSSDDEVPLAQIRSRSQVDLSLPPSASASSASARGSIDGGARAPPLSALPSRDARDRRDHYRKPSSELEVLRDQHSPPIAGSFGGARDKAHHQAQQQQQQQLGMGNPLVRRGSNRRSLSTLSFSTSMTASQQATAVAAASASAGVPGAVATAPPSPARNGAAATTRGILRPSYGARSVSNPASPTVQAFQSSSPSSSIGVPPVPALQAPALPPTASPLFASVTARDRSSASASASSGSGSASTSSVPITPKDSPSASHLGFPSSSLHQLQQQQSLAESAGGASALGKPSVKFDPVASQTDAAGWNRGRRLSAITSSAASALGAPVPPPSQQQPPSLAHRATPSMPHLGAGYAASSARGPSHNQQHLNPRSSVLPSARSSMSAAAAAPHTRASSTASASNGPSTASSSITAVDDGVYDRMKARHKAEALDALRIGRDLNHPSGRVPERATVGGGGESSDEDEPLANLPTKGSVLGGAGGSVMGGGAGSMMGGMHPQMAMGMGGAFSPLAVAPPGVDPYLYASLPLDQKMSLHQRAAQMMQMMHQASLQARAETVVAGSMIGGHDGSSSNQSFRGGLGGGMGHGSSMSLGSFDQFTQSGAGAGYGQGHGGHHQHSSSMQLPPFAPSFAMSQPFFHHPAQYSQAPSLYGMPAYAGSALGFSTGPMSAYGGGGGAPQSVMGHPASTGQLRSSGGRGGARAASTMGTGPRRP